MKLTRRKFLAWAGVAATGAIACNLFDEELQVQSPADIPEDLVRGRDNWYATYDYSAPGGQGLLVRVMEGRAKKVRGNPRFPTNRGKQSAAADAIIQSLYHPDRIAGPMLRNGPRGSGRFRAISWEEAQNRFNAAVSERGDSMLLITEPRAASFGAVCRAFAAAFGGQQLAFGGANDDSAYRAATLEILGSAGLPYHDIGNAETLVSFGSDFLSTWGNPTAYGVGYGQFRSGANTNHRGSHIHFGARYSMTAANADKWLPIAPGSEGYAALALAWTLMEMGEAHGDVDRLTGGAGAAALNEFRPDAVAGILQIPDAALGGDSIAHFFESVAGKLSHGGLAIGGGGEGGAYSNGRFNAEAALALNYLMGNVGRRGGLLPAPDSIGSDLPLSVPVATLNEWQRAADAIGRGEVRLVVVHNADPVHGLPGAVGLHRALANEEVAVISASPFIDETTAMADLLLPDRAALEAWGDDFPNPMPGYQVYAVQQPVVNPLPDLDPRSFPDVLLEAAGALGRGEAMPAEGYEEMLRANVEDRLGADFTETLQNGGWWDETATGTAPTPPAGWLSNIAGQARPAELPGSGDFVLLPFAHHTLLDGRNAHLPWAQSTPDPLTSVTWQTWVEINEAQGRGMGLREGDVVNIAMGGEESISALVYLNPGAPPGTAAVPMGGGRQMGSSYAVDRDPQESGNVVSILPMVAVEGAGGLAWGGGRCTITPTGASMAVSKLEGDYTSREIGEHPAEEVFKSVTEGESH